MRSAVEARLTWFIIGIGLLTAWGCMAYLPVENWDEARRGINALEMVRRGDYLNYYYLDQPDAFNTKPPLFLWLVMGVFRVLGESVLTLRLPSFIALAALLLYVRAWLPLHFGDHVTLLVLGALVTVNGLIGYHVGISGDTDMLFVLFTTVWALELYRYLEEGNRRRLFISAMAFLLAVLTKGVAVGLLVPGVVIGTLLHPGFRQRMKLRDLLPATVFLICGLGAIGVSLSHMGRQALSGTAYPHLLAATFLRDGLQRLGDANFEAVRQPFFIFEALDMRFGILIYGIYLAIAVALARYGPVALWKKVRRDTFLVYSLCLTASVLGLLHGSANKHNWYVAPAIPFLAYIFARGLPVLCRNRQLRIALLLALVAWASVGRGIEVHRAGTRVQRFGPRAESLPPALAERIQQAEVVYVDEHLPQAVVFRIMLMMPEEKEVQQLPAGWAGEDCGLVGGQYRVCLSYPSRRIKD